MDAKHRQLEPPFLYFVHTSCYLSEQLTVQLYKRKVVATVTYNSYQLKIQTILQVDFLLEGITYLQSRN